MNDAFNNTTVHMVARSSGPFYDLHELVVDCSVEGKVFVRKDAVNDARRFGFETKTMVLRFIANGSFDEIDFDNTERLDNGSDAGTFFDAYIFRLGPKFVYFAFYKRPNGTWIVKSFHPPGHGEKASSLSHTPFARLEELIK